MDDNNDDDSDVIEVDFNADNNVESLQLNSIWDDDMITKTITDDGSKQWTCCWCNHVFALWNGTKALCHLRKVRRSDIRACMARIDDVHRKAYDALHDAQQKKRKANNGMKEMLSGAISSHNLAVATKLDSRKKQKMPESLCDHFSSQVVAASSTASSRGSFSGVQLTLGEGSNWATANSQLTMAIADLIHSHGLPFSLASDAKFRKVLQLAKNVTSKYEPPGRNQVATDLLDLNYNTYVAKNMALLTKDSEVYGISFFGDGATVQKMPFLNILGAGVHIPAACLEIVDCTKHLERGGKKDAKYIANLFLPFIESFEKDNPNTVDLALFDGAANVQKAGELLAISYPRMSVIHGAEHVMSLFFNDLFKRPELKVCIDICRKIYKVFGSGSMHGPYALFQKKAKEHNHNRKIGLIRAADTRMGGHVIALMRLLRLEDAARSAVASVEYNSFKVRMHAVFCT